MLHVLDAKPMIKENPIFLVIQSIENCEIVMVITGTLLLVANSAS